MAEYIEREELVEWIKRIPLKDLSDGLGLCRVIMEEDFKRAIRTIPAGTLIDVAPVVHGRWEREPSSYWRWTSSGAVAVTRTTYRCGLCGRGTAVKSNYCPNCGAKMDGGGGDAGD